MSLLEKQPVFYSSGLIAILLLEHHHKQFIVYIFSNNSTKSHSSTIKFLPKRTSFQNAWFTIKCFNKVIVSYFLQRVQCNSFVMLISFRREEG